jgi:uncharacterized protein YggT (Ycf19 family)
MSTHTHTQHIREYGRDGGVIRSKEVTDSEGGELEREHEQVVAARVVWYIAGILLTLLALRFVLALLGANTANTFANFIYTVSHPFVAPFFGLFSYNLRYGVSRFESYTLVAMIVYALVAYGIAKLLTINRRYYE